MKKNLLMLLFSFSFLITIAQPTPFNGCPANNLAILRAGNNISTNPVSIYTINTSTGAPSLLSGPVSDPSNTTVNLQINGLGLNSTDGYLYGLSADATANFTTNVPLPFYRLGANAQAEQIGNVRGPAIIAAMGETQSIVNAAAGETDQSDNYYFTGATGVLTASSFTFSRLFIGIIPALHGLTASLTNVITPSYVEIKSTDPNCAAYLATLKTVFTLPNLPDAANTGLKDFVFDKLSGMLYSYVTYPDISNPGNYMGLMLRLNPATGNLTAIASPVTLSFAGAGNEVSGTLLDKKGNFLILFTNGTIYKANSTSPDMFDGSISLLNNMTNFPSLLRGDMASCGNAADLVPIPFSGCPNINLAILRQGNNAATDPVSIYNVNTMNGSQTFLSGPIADPGSAIAANLQVNGLGLDNTDGFLYGLSANTTANFATNIPLPFYRIGANAAALQAGSMPGPTRNPRETQSLVNPAAGGSDNLDNFYFSAATGTLTGASFTVNRLFLGKLSSLSSLPAPASATLTPTYFQISSADANCNNFLATLLTTYTILNAADAASSGLKDLVFDKASGKLYSYVTYAFPVGSANYYGMMVKLDPSNGNLTAVAAPLLLSFVNATVEVAGTLLDKNGNFLILFTNGLMYKANTISSGVYDGSITLLNGATGFPSILRGDMASCGSNVLLPVILNYFTAYSQDNNAVLKWQTSSEINFTNFLVEKSADGTNWQSVQTIAAAGNSSAVVQYSYTDKNIVAGTAFYRLKMVDADGQIKYSIIKKLSFNGTGVVFSYYPNPAKDVLYAESSAAFPGNVQVRMNDAVGKMYSIPFTKTDNRLALNLSALPPGIYFMQVIGGTKNSSIQKIIKQ